MKFPDPVEIPAHPSIKESELFKQAFCFQQALALMDQYGLGNFRSAVQTVPSHQDPKLREQIQNNMREMGQGYLLLFYFSMWDHYFDDVTSPIVLDDWLTKDEALKFRAMKHVRHCIAHSYDGKRARGNPDQFNQFMKGSNAFTGISYDKDTIDLSSSQIGSDCRNMMIDLAAKLVERLSSNNPP